MSPRPTPSEIEEQPDHERREDQHTDVSTDLEDNIHGHDHDHQPQHQVDLRNLIPSQSNVSDPKEQACRGEPHEQARRGGSGHSRAEVGEEEEPGEEPNPEPDEEALRAVRVRAGRDDQVLRDEVGRDNVSGSYPRNEQERKRGKVVGTRHEYQEQAIEREDGKSDRQPGTAHQALPSSPGEQEFHEQDRDSHAKDCVEEGEVNERHPVDAHPVGVDLARAGDRPGGVDQGLGSEAFALDPERGSQEEDASPAIAPTDGGLPDQQGARAVVPGHE